MAFNRRVITKELDMANLAKHNDNYTDIQTELDANASAISTHVAAQSAHGSTSDAAAGKIVQRDSDGRAKVAAPVAEDDIARKAEVDAVQTNLDEHEADAVAHLSADDRAKFNGVQAGAEPNQNAFAKVNDVPAVTKSDTLTLEGGTGITITTNSSSRKVTVTATGTATPGAHGSSHNVDGSDPIPDLVEMSKTKFTTREGKKYTINNPYSEKGSLSLKGQMHCHTTNSDGTQSPTDLVTAYKNAGYDFVTITDHDYITPDPGVVGITWIGNSSEESCNRHIVAYDIDDIYTSSKNFQDALDFHSTKGRLTNFAHPIWPNWYIASKEELSAAVGFNFIEVWNGFVGIDGGQQWDDALSSGKHVFGLATDDCHGPDTFNKGWVVAFCESNTKENILETLRRGCFYASNGNDLSISLADNVIASTCSEASDFYFIGFGGRVLSVVTNTTTANYTILGNEGYVRVKAIRKSDSTCAWSNPFFIDVVGGGERAFSEIYTELHTEGNEVMNGDFQVWQRGSSASPVNDLQYLADRWQIRAYHETTPGASTISVYKETSDMWILPNENYLKYSVTGGGGITAGEHTYCAIQQYIENGTRRLCGLGKKITISFFAKSSIPSKKIGVSIRQGYGIEGSGFSPHENYGTTLDIDQTWKKYTVTFETRTVHGKAFGSDDYLRLGFVFAWGTATAPLVGDTEGEGSPSDFDVSIARVRLVEGEKDVDIKTPTYADELFKCQRYFNRQVTNFKYSNVEKIYTAMTGFNQELRKLPILTFGEFLGVYDTPIEVSVASHIVYKNTIKNVTFGEPVFMNQDLSCVVAADADY